MINANKNEYTGPQYVKLRRTVDSPWEIERNKKEYYNNLEKDKEKETKELQLFPSRMDS